jgi:hypothetical protein
MSQTTDKLSPSGHWYTDAEVIEAEAEAHRINDTRTIRVQKIVEEYTHGDGTTRWVVIGLDGERHTTSRRPTVPNQPRRHTVESIKPEAIERGMVLVDEVNGSAYTVLDVQRTLTDSYFVKGLALTNWGSLIQKNFTYLAEDGELYVVARPAPFALPELPTRELLTSDESGTPGLESVPLEDDDEGEWSE